MCANLNDWTNTLVGKLTAKRLAARAASEGMSVQEFGRHYAAERGWGCQNTAVLLVAWAAFDNPFAFASERERCNAEMRAALAAGDLEEVADARFDTPALRPVTATGRALSARMRDASSTLALRESHAYALSAVAS